MSGRRNGHGAAVEPFPEEWASREAMIEWIQNDIETWLEAGWTVAEYAEAHDVGESWVYRMRRGEGAPGAKVLGSMDLEVEFQKFGRKVRGRR